MGLPELALEGGESETGQTSEVPVDLRDSDIELNPILELEKLQLDLETDSLEIKPMQANPSSDPEAPLEGSELKMDSSEDQTEESAPDR